MKVKDARRQRLTQLRQEYGTLDAIAAELNRGRKKPNRYLAQYLSNIYNGARGMGSRFARRMETALGKAEGWMDHVGASSIEASELLSIWGKFPAEEQARILEELRIRLRVIQDKPHISQDVGDRLTRPPKPRSS